MSKQRILNVRRTGQSASQQQQPAQDDVEMTDLSVASHTNINTNANHEETISLNEAFASKLIRLTFPMPILQEIYKKEKVESDRGYLVEA